MATRSSIVSNVPDCSPESIKLTNSSSKYLGYLPRVIAKAVGAGSGSGIADSEYSEVGAEVVSDALGVFSRAEMIVKVKEPLPAEYELLQPGQTV